MRIIYIIKKGFQFFPPCLTQVLYLHELGAELTIYHGKNTKQIDDVLNSLGIDHYTLNSDSKNPSTIRSYINFALYSIEASRIINQNNANILFWFGNCESAITIPGIIKKYKYILNDLELYELGSLYDRLTKKVISRASIVTCCEKHRSALMKERYKLQKEPIVIPNKPYDGKYNYLFEIEDRASHKDIIDQFVGKNVLLYQGLIREDRPIDNIARALKKINNKKNIFVIMGKADVCYIDKIKKIYKNTIFTGFIPAPDHLQITKYAQIGIAVYDRLNLNNEFCAPNKIYEYAKYGVPMLTSQNIGLLETIGQAGAGKCVDLNDVDEITKAIIEIQCNHSTMSNKAIDFYHATDISKIITNLYLKIQELA